MAFDFHPIFVHFPIALLSIYTCMEIIRFSYCTRQHWWFHTKAVLIITGFIGGVLALLSGDSASDAYHGTSTMNIIELHAAFAQVSMIVFGLLAFSYVIRWIDRDEKGSKLSGVLKEIFVATAKVERTVFMTPVIILGAVIGFILLSIVGALGGAIVYGPDIDPVVSFVYYIFFPK